MYKQNSCWIDSHVCFLNWMSYSERGATWLPINGGNAWRHFWHHNLGAGSWKVAYWYLWVKARAASELPCTDIASVTEYNTGTIELGSTLAWKILLVSWTDLEGTCISPGVWTLLGTIHAFSLLIEFLSSKRSYLNVQDDISLYPITIRLKPNSQLLASSCDQGLWWFILQSFPSVYIEANL